MPVYIKQNQYNEFFFVAGDVKDMNPLGGVRKTVKPGDALWYFQPYFAVDEGALFEIRKTNRVGLHLYSYTHEGLKIVTRPIGHDNSRPHIFRFCDQSWGLLHLAPLRIQFCEDSLLMVEGTLFLNGEIVNRGSFLTLGVIYETVAGGDLVFENTEGTYKVHLYNHEGEVVESFDLTNQLPGSEFFIPIYIR